MQYVEWVSPFGRFCISMGLFVLCFALVFFTDGRGVTGRNIALWSIALAIGESGVFSVPGDWWNLLLNYLF